MTKEVRLPRHVIPFHLETFYAGFTMVRGTWRKPNLTPMRVLEHGQGTLMGAHTRSLGIRIQDPCKSRD